VRCCRQFSITVSTALSLFHNYSLQFTKTRPWSSRSALPHQSFCTGFERQTFPYFGSRTVPSPQPQRVTEHYPYWSASSCFDLYCLELSPITDSCCQSQSQSYITIDSQAPIRDPRPIFPLLSLISFRQLRVCWCGAPSLTIGRICNLQCNDASSISYIATDGLSARF
jgi:hypothetical protein